jgi:phosphate transport system permease protein
LSPSTKDALLLAVLRACAVLSAAVVALIVAFVARDSWPALRDVGVVRFFSDSWSPTGAEPGFGITPMLVATLVTSAGAVALATPMGIASAVFAHFYAPRPLATVQRRVIELLAGIPSVVYGLWGLVVLVPLLLRFAPPGQSVLAGTLVLTVMILPTVALMADVALASVPAPTLQAAHALALPRHAIALRVALPAARSGIVTGIVLAAGRAVGETMAVLMVCGNVVKLPTSIFDPVRTLTANIALEMGYALADHRAALFVSGLCLLLMWMALVSATGLMRGGQRA